MLDAVERKTCQIKKIFFPKNNNVFFYELHAL